MFKGIRENTFRDCNLNVQLKSCKSIIKHVIKPLNRKCTDIKF